MKRTLLSCVEQSKLSRSTIRTCCNLLTRLTFALFLLGAISLPSFSNAQEFRATIGDAEYDEVSCTHDRSLSNIETKPKVCFRGRLETLIH